MPCYTIISINVEDEQIARDALKEMGYTASEIDQMISVYGKSVEVSDFRNRTDERRFRQQYGVTGAISQGKKDYYRVDKQETLSDGSIRITLKR